MSSLPRGLFRLSSTGLDSLLSWMMDTEDVAEGEQGREISWTDWIEIGEEDPEEITTGESREPEPGKALDTAGDGTLGPLFLTLDLALCELADEGAVVGLCEEFALGLSLVFAVGTRGLPCELLPLAAG